MIKIGILGASAVAPYAMIEPAALRDDCTISVIACRDQARGEAFARTHNIRSVETNYEALFRRDDVDLIYNTLPPSRHADLSIAAMDADLPVLCEKPFAMNASEAQKMSDASQRTGQFLIEAFHYRFHPAFMRLLEIIKNGTIGDIIRMQAIFAAPVPYREGEIRHTLAIGGGTLMDMGCYPVHWSRMIMGAEPEVRSAECFTLHPEIDVTTKAVLDFGPKGISEIECSMDADRPFQAELTVWGTEGKVKFKNPLSPHMGHQIIIEKDVSTHTEQIAGKRTYDYQLEHILNVFQGTEDAIGGGQDAISNMRIIDAIYRSAGLTPR